MIYIIGGACTFGKSILAKKISRKYNIPYFSIDWWVMGMKSGVPDLEVSDTLFPLEIAEKFGQHSMQ